MSRIDHSRSNRTPVAPVLARCATRSTDERYEKLRRRCPTCGELGLRIIYGYPSGPLVAAARRGKIIIGGCTYRAATHRCANGHIWEHPGVSH